MDNKTIFRRYAQKHDNGELHNVYDNLMVYRSGLVCGPQEEVFEVSFTECEKNEHDMVAWQETGSNDISMIFASKLLLTVCFPYGLDAAVNAGKGRCVYLKTISCKPLGKAGELRKENGER